mgnify:CR=1 FL=1
MPRRLFIGLFLLPLPLFAAPPKDELAYAVGARLGMRLQQEMPGLGGRALPVRVPLQGIRAA